MTDAKMLSENHLNNQEVIWVAGVSTMLRDVKFDHLIPTPGLIAP